MSAAYFRTLTIAHALVPSAQSDFPVLVIATDATLKTVANGGHVQTGFDLGFYADSAGTTKLKWEMESYDAATGALVAHVKVPSVSSSVDTVFYLLYGDAAVITDQSDAAGVWSNSYALVVHLGDGTTLNTNDSLGAHNGTPGGPVAAIGGQIRGGAFFQSPSYMAFGDIGVHNPPFTIEAWVAPYNNVYASLLNTGSWDGHYLSHDPTGVAHGATSVANGFAVYSSAFKPSTGSMVWQHVAAVFASNSSRQLFVNGSGGTIDTVTVVPGATPNGFVLGADWAHTNNYYGYMDEVRVSSVARSADWIATTYNSLSAPGSFVALGAEQVGAVDVFVLLTGVGANPQIGEGTLDIGIAEMVHPTGGISLRLREPAEKKVYLKGVSASPEIGTGFVCDISKLYPFPQQDVPTPVVRSRKAPKQKPTPIPVSIVISMTGVKAAAAAGSGTVKTVFELLDEELVALMEAA